MVLLSFRDPIRSWRWLPSQRVPWNAGSALFTFVVSLLLAGCGNSSRPPIVHTTVTPSPTSGPISFASDCPDPDLKAIQTGAMLTLHPDNGPVNTQVTVDITGLQPGCHLWLGLTVEPVASETGGTPLPAPRQTGGALQWVSVSSAGEIHTIFCVCANIYSYVLGFPPYPSATPPPHPGGNVQVFAPRKDDHFFITLAGATIADPPPLYALFTVTG